MSTLFMSFMIFFMSMCIWCGRDILFRFDKDDDDVLFYLSFKRQHPTRALCPILLEDYRRISGHRLADADREIYSFKDIENCMSKVTSISIGETIWIGKKEDQRSSIVVRAYLAGHVLGAAMFFCAHQGDSVLYSGDYNMSSDRHLGGGSVDRLRPSLLVTESTYSTTIRESRRIREHEFLEAVHQCVDAGGKVLIPIFAVGRAQELGVLIDTHWERMGLDVPVYFSAGMMEKANFYYKLFFQWMNENMREHRHDTSAFSFKHIRPLEKGMETKAGPMVVFATPGMLHAGKSLAIFKKWASNSKNLVILPGFCVKGTVGNKLLSHPGGILEIDKYTSIDVECSVKYMSFSAHADARGIFQLIRQLEPQNICLVHGEKSKMDIFQKFVKKEIRIPCFCPANGEEITIKTKRRMEALASASLLTSIRQASFDGGLVGRKRERDGTVEAFFLRSHDDKICVVPREELAKKPEMKEHKFQFRCNIRCSKEVSYDTMAPILPEFSHHVSGDTHIFSLESIKVTFTAHDPLSVSVVWDVVDDDRGNLVVNVLQGSALF
eukprot:TRINITY_DN1216_c0_g1_i1.p1 TRINITY_DN1216_c0_g1~~TRINITY_DN1216_c0_g1_i1.p1  ORF type:complete len:552 (+),score=151.19 TRINITY_DN1216_c0_g1_i1:389-2044(+)